MKKHTNHSNETQNNTSVANRPSWGKSTHYDYQYLSHIQPGHTKPDKMRVTLFILLMAWTAIAKQDCYRVTKTNQLFREVTSLGHLDLIMEHLQELKERRLITKSTWLGMNEIVEDMGHGWCKPRGLMKKNKNTKRNVLVVAGLSSIFTIGLLKIGPALASLFNTGDNPSPKYIEYMRSLGNITRIHGELLDSLEKRVINLELKMRADNAIINILTLAMRESQIYRDLSKLNKKSNKILLSMFEASVKHFGRLGLLENSSDTDAINGPFPLPHETWSVSIRVKRNVKEDCNTTEVFVEGVSSLPSEECYYKISNYEAHTLLGRNHSYLGKNITTFTISGPEDIASTKLQDGSIFIVSNNYILPTRLTGGIDMVYRDATLMIRPTSRAYALNLCTPHKWKFRLFRDRAYFVPLQCGSIISTSINTTQLGWASLAQQPTSFIDNKGKQIDLRGALNQKGDGILWRPFWAYENVNITETKKHKIYNIEFPSLNEDKEEGGTNINMIIATAVISMLASGGVAACCWRMQIKRRREDIEHIPALLRWSRTKSRRDSHISVENASAAEGSVLWVRPTQDEEDSLESSNGSRRELHIYDNVFETNHQRITNELKEIASRIEEATSQRFSTNDDTLGIDATTRIMAPARYREASGGESSMSKSLTSIKPVTWPLPVMNEGQSTDQTDHMEATNDLMDDVNRELTNFMKNDMKTHTADGQDKAMEQGATGVTWRPSRITPERTPRPKYRKFGKLLKQETEPTN